MHGMPNLMNTHRTVIRIMWAICILSSAGVGFYFSSNCVLDYLNFEVVSSISIINEQSLEFPTISLCSTVSYFYFFNYPILNSVKNWHFLTVYLPDFNEKTSRSQKFYIYKNLTAVRN